MEDSIRAVKEEAGGITTPEIPLLPGFVAGVENAVIF